MKDGQTIRFAGEGDQCPGVEAGDILIVLDEQDDKDFKRQGDDLLTGLDITLSEALCGFRKPIVTLDARTLLVITVPGKFSNFPKLSLLPGIKVGRLAWKTNIHDLSFYLF